jgi:hypothetical protein
MNIEKSYKERMLKSLETWYETYKAGNDITAYTAGYAVDAEGNPYQKDGNGYHGFGGCGGFMGPMYNRGVGARLIWPVIPNLSAEEGEELFKLWLTMINELYIPVKYIGIKEIKDSSISNSLYTLISSSNNTLDLYKRVYVVEILRSNYVSQAHYKCAHTAIRYMFRYGMMDAFYHTVRMKLNFPALSVQDCLVTASYFCSNYSSSMMLFRWWVDNNEDSIPVPRSRGEIIKQLQELVAGKILSQTKKKITFLYTKTVSPKMTKELKWLTSFAKKLNAEVDTSNYLKALKILRESSVKHSLNEAITA